MARVDITDFSGGIREVVSPGDFTERQSSIIHGFVLEDEVRLRSQGAIQKVSALSNVIAVRPLRGANNNYLIIIRSNGTVSWTVAPDRLSDNTTTKAVTFTTFSGALNGDYRFTTEFTYRVNNEYKQALLLHSLSGSVAAKVIYEGDSGLEAEDKTSFFPSLSQGVTGVTVMDGGAGYTTAPAVTITGGGGSGAVAETKIENGVITAVTVTKSGSGYTTAPTIGFTGGSGTGATAFSVISKLPQKGVFPRHNVACVWRDSLVLADIEWSSANADSGLTAANTTRYSNFAWISEIDALDPDQARFDPRYPQRLAPEGATIVGLQSVPEGLLVLSTTASGQAGLSLVRGEPQNFSLEVLRPGLGLPDGIDSTQRTPVHTWWNEVASTLFIDSLGKIYQVRGMQTDRIDRYGPTAPEKGTAHDSISSIGSWLFVVRDSRLLVMRSFGQDGAWTEIVTPSGAIKSLAPLEDTMYFVASGVLYRYCIEGLSQERGTINGSQVDLTYASRTLGNPQEVLDKFWDGATIRSQGLSSASLRSVELLGGSPLQSSVPPSALFTVNKDLSARDMESVPGLGPSIECSVKATFRGDVRIENISLSVEPGDDQL